MDRRTARTIVTVSMALYLLLVSSSNAREGFDRSHVTAAGAPNNGFLVYLAPVPPLHPFLASSCYPLRFTIIRLLVGDKCRKGYVPPPGIESVQDRYRSLTIKRQNYDKDVLHLLYRDIDSRQRRGHHMSDAGYGSRMQAGAKVANALIAHHLYGAYGPGRRKRAAGIPRRAFNNHQPFLAPQPTT